MSPAVRRFVLLALVGSAFALVACGSDDADGADESLRWDARSLQTSTADLPFIPTVINSSLSVGPGRVVVALIDPADGGLLEDATVEGAFYRLAEDPEAEPGVAVAVTEPAPLTTRVLDLKVGQSESGSTSRFEGASGTASLHPIGLTPPRRSADVLAHDGDHSITTVYTANVAFDEPGFWGLTLDIELGGESYDAALKFWVAEESPEVSIGEQAPRSEQLTLADVDELSEVSTAPVPNEAMLDQTVAEALDTGRPVVVAFVTPAFCQTRFCGPVLEAVVEPAWEQYGDRVEFVHIEPFDLDVIREQGTYEPVPTAVEWRLRTEPFLFVIDADGIVRHKIEGVTDLAELSAAIEDVLEAGA